MMRKIVLFIFVFVFLSISASGEESPQQFQGFNLVGYGEDGEKDWDIEGDTADIIGDTVEISNITANSYGDEDMNLTAKKGTLDKTSGNMLLEEDVVITTDTGAKMTTDSLRWKRNDDLVTTKDEVIITKETMKAVGTGAKAHPGLNQAQLNEDVTVTVDVESGESAQTRAVTITCEGPLEIDYEKQTAVFNKDVVAIDGDRKLLADKVEVYFDAESSKIKEMICIGNVVIFQGENASYSEKAIYNATDQKMTLLGRPKLIFYPDGETDVSFGE